MPTTLKNKRLLYLTVPQEVFINMSEQTQTFIKQLIEEGIPLVVSNYDFDILPMETLSELGIFNVIVAKNLYMKSETVTMMNKLKHYGFNVFCNKADEEDSKIWLEVSGATYVSGELTGELIDEETLIQSLLTKENING